MYLSLLFFLMNSGMRSVVETTSEWGKVRNFCHTRTARLAPATLPACVHSTWRPPCWLSYCRSDLNKQTNLFSNIHYHRISTETQLIYDFTSMTAVSIKPAIGELVARFIFNSWVPRLTALANLSRTIFSRFLKSNHYHTENITFLTNNKEKFFIWLNVLKQFEVSNFVFWFSKISSQTC